MERKEPYIETEKSILQDKLKRKLRYKLLANPVMIFQRILYLFLCSRRTHEVYIIRVEHKTLEYTDMKNNRGVRVINGQEWSPGHLEENHSTYFSNLSTYFHTITIQVQVTIVPHLNYFSSLLIGCPAISFTTPTNLISKMQTYWYFLNINIIFSLLS